MYWSSGFSIIISFFFADDKKSGKSFLVVFFPFWNNSLQITFRRWLTNSTWSTRTYHNGYQEFLLCRRWRWHKATFSRAGAKSRLQSRVLPSLRDDPALRLHLNIYRCPLRENSPYCAESHVNQILVNMKDNSDIWEPKSWSNLN